MVIEWKWWAVGIVAASICVMSGCTTLGLRQQTEKEFAGNTVGFHWTGQEARQKTDIMAEGNPGDAARAALPWVSLALCGGGVGVGVLSLLSRKKIWGIAKVLVNVIQKQKDAGKIMGDDIRKTVADSSVRPDVFSKIVTEMKRT